MLWKILVGPRYQNLGLFSLILVPNLVAALLEGISFGFILAALSTLSESPLPVFGAYIRTVSGFDPKELFLSFTILGVGCQAIRSAVGGIAMYANSVLALRIQEELQIEIYKKIFDLSYRCVSQYKIGDLAEHAKTPTIIVNAIMDNSNRLLISLLMILATFGVMLILNVKLALLTLLLLILTGALHKWIVLKIGRASEKLSDFVVECSKYTIQMLQSIRTIHTYNRQDYAFSKIKQMLNQMILESKTVYFWNHFIPSINELLGVFLVAAILFTGMGILSGDLPTLITFIALTHRLAIRIQSGNGSLGIILSHKGSMIRLKEILSDTGKEMAPNSGALFSGFTDKIQLQDVELQYPTTTQAAIQKLSLLIPKGKTIAFVGASGAGKSSLLDILTRLYEPTGGFIHIDGKELKNYSVSSWRDRLGVVSQDISIFNDTIEENIRFGLDGPADLIHAAKLSGLHEFVDALPDKYQTIVGERGFRLSGGQRQRLALARALIRNPEILILDEATSNLDTQSEYLIQSALEKLRSKQTILIVAHRLSTIINADHIYVLDQGQIIEEGTHLHLLQLNGAYTKFWQAT